LGVMVFGKREMVLGVEPAVIGSAEAFKGSAFDHFGSPGISVLRVSRPGCVSTMRVRSLPRRAFSMAEAKTMHRRPAPCSRTGLSLYVRYSNYQIRLRHVSNSAAIPLPAGNRTAL